MARAIDLIETPARRPRLPLDLRGTDFQHRVWQALGRRLVAVVYRAAGEGRDRPYRVRVPRGP